MSVVFPIEDDPRFRIYTASEGQKTFPIAFPFQQGDDILVQRDAGAGFLDVPKTEYGTEGAGEPDGGSLAFLAGQEEGVKIAVIGNAVLSRLSSIVAQGKFKSALTDGEFDRVTIIVQELSREIERSLRSELGQSGLVLDANIEDGDTLMKVGNRLKKGANASEVANAQANAEIAAAAAVMAAKWADNGNAEVIAGKFAAEYWARKALEWASTGVAGVTSFNGRAGGVLPTDADYTAGMIAHAGSNAGALLDALDAGLDEATAQLASLDWFAGLVPGYVSSSQITISSGYGVLAGKRCQLAAQITRSFAALFGAGNGILDTGLLQPSKTYFLYAVRRLSDGLCDVVASLSTTAGGVNMTNLAGWEVIAGGRVGLVLTNASGQIVPFVQNGNYCAVTNTTINVAGSGGGSISNQIVLIAAPTCPIGISVDLMCGVALVVSNAAGAPDCNTSLGHAYGYNSALGSSTHIPAVVAGARTSSDGTDRSYSGYLPVRTDTLARIVRYIDSIGTFSCTYLHEGWVDWQCRRLWG